MILSTLATSLWLLTATAYAPARQGMDPLTPEQEAHVQQLGKQLRCPVCQGLSIADSQASSARAQMDKVRELIVQGKTDEEIREFFVDRYGEWALLDPSTNGINIFLWAGPLLLLGLGGLVIVWRTKKPAPTTANSSTTHEDDPYLRQIRSDLEK